MLQESHALQLVLWRPLTRLEEGGQVLLPLPVVLYAVLRPGLQKTGLKGKHFSHQQPDLFYPHYA